MTKEGEGVKGLTPQAVKRYTMDVIKLTQKSYGT